MDSLPIELISQILSHLSLRDCYNLEQTYLLPHRSIETENSSEFRIYSKILSCVVDRKSVSKYIGKYFMNSKSLLQSMLDNSVIISGSRALEFFAGDSTSEDSDWDFFMPLDTEKVQQFMHNTIKNGIRWISTIEEFENDLNGSKEEIKMQVNKLTFLSRYVGQNSVNQYTKSIIEKVKSEYDLQISTMADVQIAELVWTTQILNTERQVKELTIIRQEDYIDEKTIIVPGELTYQGCKTKVQLMLTPKEKSVIDVLIKFHISIVQCFISGSMACHMYSNDAYNRESTVWNLSETEVSVDKEGIARSVARYKLRGYKFYNKSTHFINNPSRNLSTIKRCIGDANTEVVMLHNFGQAGNISMTSKISLQIEELFKYSWIERKEFLDVHYSSMFRSIDYKQRMFNMLYRYIAQSPQYSDIENDVLDLIHNFRSRLDMYGDGHFDDNESSTDGNESEVLSITNTDFYALQ